jgi:hypothetical protein
MVLLWSKGKGKNMNKKEIAIKQIKDQMRKLEHEKKFLENEIHNKVYALEIYNHFNDKREIENIIGYLNMTWERYERVLGVITSLKKDLKGSKSKLKTF